MEKLELSKSAQEFVDDNTRHYLSGLSWPGYYKSVREIAETKIYSIWGYVWRWLVINLRYNYFSMNEAINFLNDPLNKLRFFIARTGKPLAKQVERYNVLVEAEKFKEATDYQKEICQRTKPTVEKLLQYFEQCVQYYYYRKKVERLRGEAVELPQLGLEVEELENAIKELNIATSSEALAATEKNMEREIALIELEQGLGNTLSLPIVSDPNPAAP